MPNNPLKHEQDKNNNKFLKIGFKIYIRNEATEQELAEAIVKHLKAFDGVSNLSIDFGFNH